jgi:hydrogenase nickel incorporation protein HypA/HybF
MHEFTLAQNILEIVDETVKKNNVTTVKEVELEIGKLSGVEIDALETAIECLKPGSLLEYADVRMILIDGIGICRSCRHRFSPSDLFAPCPKCNSYHPEIISGKELRVKSITTE